MTRSQVEQLYEWTSKMLLVGLVLGATAWMTWVSVQIVDTRDRLGRNSANDDSDVSTQRIGTAADRRIKRLRNRGT